MRYSHYITTVLLAFLVFVAFAATTNYMFDTDQYDVSVGATYRNAYTNHTELKNFVKDTTNISLDMDTESTEAKMIEGEFDDASESYLPALSVAKDSFSVVKDMLIAVSNALMIPPIITAIVIAIIIFAMLFATISLIFRFKS